MAAGVFYWGVAPGEASGAGLWFSLLGAYEELSSAYLKFEVYGFGGVFLDWLLWFYENGLAGLGLLDASRKLRSAVKELSRLLDEFRSRAGVDAVRGFLEAVSGGGLGFLLDALRDAVSGVLRVEAVVEGGVYRVCNKGFFPVTGVVDGFLRSIPPGGCVDAGGPGVVEVSAPGVGSRVVEIGGDKPIRVEPVEAPRVVREEAPVGASGGAAAGPGLSAVLELAGRGLKGFREDYGCSGGVFEAGVTGFTPDWINGGWSCCRLGCGGWGCAYRCKREGRTVVFKVPLGFEGLLEGGEVPSVSSRMLGKVVERARVLMALRHPGIVGLLGVLDGGRACPGLRVCWAGEPAVAAGPRVGAHGGGRGVCGCPCGGCVALYSQPGLGARRCQAWQRVRQ